jgi:ABC-2 type transport system permease protein
MFLEIVKFEIIYRLRRPVTYIYFLLFLAISFMFVAIPNVSFSDSSDQLLRNSPVLVTQLMLVIMMFGSLVCAAIMGVPVYRDYEHRFNEIMHALPVKKTAYLWGRFLGSFIIAALVFSAIVLGMALGFAMPWQEKDTIGPFQISVYLNAYFLFILPNLLVLGSLFFIVGSYFRSQVAIYAQGVVFVVLYFVVSILFNDSTQHPIYSILEPFGVEAIGQVTKYWTVFEKNTLNLNPEGLIFYNRILWLSLSVIVAVIFNRGFNVSRRNSYSLNKSRKSTPDFIPGKPGLLINDAVKEIDTKARFYQWWHLSKFYFKSIVRSIPFLIMIICGIGLIAMMQFSSSIYGLNSLPVTYMLLDNLSGGFMLFAIIIMIVYSGELIWKEIGNRFSMILDSSPLSNQQIILSKFTAMILAEILIAGVIMFTGITIQVINGFYEFQLMIYIKYLLLNFLPLLFLFTLLTFLIHTLVNNKFLGHGLVILFYVSRGFYGKLGIQQMLFKYASAPTESYSGMNGFHKFVYPVLSFDFYWLMLGIIFLSLSILFIKRGTESGYKIRLRLFRLNWQHSRIKYIVALALILFVLSGCALYYNTNVLNTYRTKKETRQFQAAYERTYSHYKNTPQPRIVDVNLNVAIYPNDYGMTARGRYILVNKNSMDIDSIHLRIVPEVKIKEFSFGRKAKLLHQAPEYGYYIYQLENPLKPGDTLTCQFNVEYWEKGFPNAGRSTDIVPNGTFFRNEVLPYFGYDERFVITDKKDRKKEGLPEREFEAAALSDSSAYRNTYISQNADRINYEAVVSTDVDQTALTCGALVKEWEKNGRRYFHYKMNEPIWNFVPFLSARYEVVRDKAGDTEIEIYYHPGHKYNLDKMISAAKKTIAYCDSNFYPYQHPQLRIVEFPRYAMYAQSFAGIIPFSEGVGFIVDVNDDKDIDLPFYITSHEIAHQWWGHQVCAADVKGKLLLVESLANYTALMVMEKEFGHENISKFLEYEQSKYLLSRSLEKKKEVPLNLVDQQSYVAYEKGSVALYALRDYLGESVLNTALGNFMKFYSYREAPYPTSNDLLSNIERATPDSLKYLINDFFRTITLFSNRIDSASFSESTKGNYNLRISATIQKFRADSLGMQTEITPGDWLDMGIYSQGSDGKDSLVYIAKVLVDSTKFNYNLTINSKPSKVGIDPLHLMIDRNSDDNIKPVKKKV